MNNDQYVGMTETGEIAYHLEAFDNLYDANIIITKLLTNDLINKLVQHKDKCILHLTCTGMGYTKYEPNVPHRIWTRSQFTTLISEGFPIEQVVLRIDPILCNNEGVYYFNTVIDLFKNSGIKRVRISFLDMYNHVVKRFDESNIIAPQRSFHAPLPARQYFYNYIKEQVESMGAALEVCGEPGIESISCLSQKDLDILGVKHIILQGSAEQRTSCHCPANKKQILRIRPHRCNNKCAYCYWKD